ncbi:MAG: hypothetical protein ACI9RO_000156 [Alteromonas macleodii]|jgi:hypothetical protein
MGKNASLEPWQESFIEKFLAVLASSPRVGDKSNRQVHPAVIKLNVKFFYGGSPAQDVVLRT